MFLEVFSYKLGITTYRTSLSFCRGLAEAVRNAEDDVGIGGTHPRLAAQEGCGAEAVIAGCVKDVVRHKTQLQFAAEQGLTGCKVKIHIGCLPTLGEVMPADEVPVELQSGVLCQAEIVNPAHRASRVVSAGTPLVCGAEVVERQVAVRCKLPPACGLRRDLQLQALPPSVAGIHDAV